MRLNPTDPSCVWVSEKNSAARWHSGATILAMRVTAEIRPLFRRLYPIALCLVFGLPSLCHAQMPLPPLTGGSGYAGEVPQFDVISVKPHRADDGSVMTEWGTANFAAKNVDLKSIISDVYGVKVWLVFGLPPWALSSRWDIDAKMSSPDIPLMQSLSEKQRIQMIGEILKERFGMVIHQETKVQPVFALTVMPGGARLTQSPPLPPNTADGHDPEGGPGWSWGRGTLKAARITMHQLTDLLSYQVDRTIIDKTGLTGEYDLTLKWSSSDQPDAVIADGTEGDMHPAIFEALKEQLGLKLTAEKTPVPTVVVDKIVQPEAN